MCQGADYEAGTVPSCRLRRANLDRVIKQPANVSTCDLQSVPSNHRRTSPAQQSLGEQQPQATAPYQVKSNGVGRHDWATIRVSGGLPTGIQRFHRRKSQGEAKRGQVPRREDPSTSREVGRCGKRTTPSARMGKRTGVGNDKPVSIIVVAGLFGVVA
jgi:hypothetical protein